jgi:hypothetical protein
MTDGIYGAMQRIKLMDLVAELVVKVRGKTRKKARQGSVSETRWETKCQMLNR